MKSVISILHRVLVNYFYKVNTGFFLFLFFVLFGMPYSPLQFHLALINGILKSEATLLPAMFIWLMYTLKCTDYILKQLDHSQQNFLFCINNLPRQRVYISMIYVHLMVYMPVLIYSVIVFCMALKRHLFVCALQVACFDILSIAASAALYLQRLEKKNIFSTRLTVPLLHIKFVKPLFLVPLTFLWHERKQMLLVTKVFSMLVLLVFINLYEPEQHDIRPLELCLLLCMAAHSAIVFQLRNFEEEYLSFTKSLPIRTSKRFLWLLLCFLILLLPEYLLLIKGYGIHFSAHDYPQLMLLSLALLLIFYVTLLMDDLNMDEFIRVMFGIMAACFFALLYNKGLLLSACMIVLAYVFYASYYYTFEKKNDK